MEVVNSAAGKPSESDPDSSTRIRILKPVSCSNGVLKRTNHVGGGGSGGGGGNGGVVYKECLKNHAASIGAHAVDGCGEFMPSPAANPADPTSLKCAACGCHRNFHRQATEEEDSFPASNTTTTTTPALEYQPHHRHHPPQPPPPPGDGGTSTPSSPSPPPISSSYYPSAPHLLLTLSGGSTPVVVGNRTAAPVAINGGRKRFRTRFTHNQKEKMLEFAEKLEWKMQKKDEDLIANFCNEIAVEKGVFKVWMHNNKNIFGRKEHSNSSLPATTTTIIGIHPNSTTSTSTATAAAPAAVSNNNGNGSISFLHHHLLQNHGGQNEINSSNNNNHNHNHFHGDSFDDGRVAGPNGSSSSS